MPHRILIVEDEPVVLNFAVAVLKGSGHEVMTATSAAAARKLLATQADGSDLCLVIDVVLDDDSGIALAQEVVKLNPGFRVLLISGFTDDVLIAETKGAEKISFLRKPFTKNELISAVASICD